MHIAPTVPGPHRREVLLTLNQRHICNLYVLHLFAQSIVPSSEGDITQTLKYTEKISMVPVQG